MNGSLNFHFITDIDISTENNSPTTVYDSNGKASTCEAFKMTRITLIDKNGGRFEILAFREGV